MITRQELKKLQSLTQIPALSILLPTHRTSPDNKQDPILVKNLVDEAKRRLSAEFSKREIEPLFDRLDSLVAEIDGSSVFVMQWTGVIRDGTLI